MLVHLCWGPVAQSLVRPLPVVELQVGIDPSSGLGDGLVSFQIHLLVLDAPPQPLHEDVVQVPTLTIHADLDPLLLQRLGKGLTGELTPLVDFFYRIAQLLCRFVLCRFHLSFGLVKGYVLLKNQNLLRFLGLAARSAVRGKSCAVRSGRHGLYQAGGCCGAAFTLPLTPLQGGVTASWADQQGRPLPRVASAARRLAWERLARSLHSCVSSSHRRLLYPLPE